MSDLEKYIACFSVSLQVAADDLSNLSYQDIPAWDSLGHMNLMASLEEEFSIELDIDDIIDFSSFERGKLILERYGVKL